MSSNSTKNAPNWPLNVDDECDTWTATVADDSRRDKEGEVGTIELADNVTNLKIHTEKDRTEKDLT